MTGRTSLGHITESEFSNLLGALSASTKGRSFLDEYRRRARPEETDALLGALHRIEATIATVRDQLQPERIADELHRIAMTLEIATGEAECDPEGDESARRMALVDRARMEIVVLAGGLAGHRVQPIPSIDSGQRRASGRETESFAQDWGADDLP